jgi:hypothetical protein
MAKDLPLPDSIIAHARAKKIDNKGRHKGARNAEMHRLYELQACGALLRFISYNIKPVIANCAGTADT